MVFAVYGGPLSGNHARREPQPEAKEVAGQRMKRQGVVRLGPVEIDRDSGDGSVGQRERCDHYAPPWQA